MICLLEDTAALDLGAASRSISTVSFLSGEADIRSSDREKRHFRQGDVLLLEDTTGKGHYTESDLALAAVIQFPLGVGLFRMK
ncbi:MAG: hypothetical protein ACRECH_11100 [Nitrososphaerales archaeon]